MMSFKMKTGLLFCTISLFIFFAVSSDCIGNDQTIKKCQRPPVTFNHQDHLSSNDCLKCHHKYENKKNVLDPNDLTSINPNPDEIMTLDLSSMKDSNEIKCASCHSDKNKVKKIDTRDAFHKQCIGCHEAKSAGPVLCGECHKRSNKKSDGK